MKASFAVLGLLACLGLTAAQNCDSDQFECVSTGDCVPDWYVCDGFDDCGDGSDEPPIINPDECPACTIGQWRCSNGVCINENYQCDTDNDCGDWSDESADNCPCSGSDVHCAQGPCIPEDYWCDLIWDCPDGSDETNCTNADVIKTTKVRPTKLVESKADIKRHILKQKAHQKKAAKKH